MLLDDVASIERRYPVCCFYLHKKSWERSNSSRLDAWYPYVVYQLKNIRRPEQREIGYAIMVPLPAELRLEEFRVYTNKH